MAESCNIKGKSTDAIFLTLADYFKGEYEKTNNEFCFDIPDKYGSGNFSGYQFSHGINVLIIDVLLKKSLNLTFEIDVTNPLTLFFNEKANLEHVAQGETHSVTRMNRVILSNSVSENHTFKIKGNKPSSAFIININRKEFEEKIDSFSKDLPEDLALIFRDLNGVNYVCNHDYFSLDVSDLIEEFKDCELDELMKPIFLEGKTYEILTHQIQKYTDDLGGKSKKQILRKSTITKIQEAVDIIKSELEVSINVHALAKRVGLNQNTLQSGFKTLFDTSVNDYIKNHRLELAKHLIETSDLNITEITYKIGINSRSYFSKLFKERYDVNPKEYLSRIRKNTKSA